jgi:hypothetical protein
MDTQRVQISDNYKKSQKDVFAATSKRPRGFVEIFEKTNSGLDKLDEVEVDFPLHEGPNLIVYPGRTWLMQRAFDQELSTIDYTANDKGSYISWFGLGTGGATPGDVLNPISPELGDLVLAEPAEINIIDDCVDAGRLHPFDSIVFEEDTANSNEFLISKVTTTIGQNDANGDGNPDDFYNLSEAGLYISNSNDPLTFVAQSKILFARVTFSTIRKHALREIVFIWSIYF